jgi:glutaredoxin
VIGFQDAASFRQQLQELITITVFVRQGCPHCADAKAYLSQLRLRFPGFEVRLRDAVADARAKQEMQELIRQHRATAASLPVFHACDELLIGFDSPATTGARLEAILQRWTRECPAPEKPSPGASSTPAAGSRVSFATVHRRIRLVSNSQADDEQAGEDRALPLPTEAELPLPGVRTPADSSEIQESPLNGAIRLPFFGDVRVEQIGLPLFTVAVGLVDGFNPCAMWVLMFLLSILVNLRSRAKILSVAGSFVLISGAAYFAFMAAWLNVFLLLGLLTWVRLTLASLAIVMGVIHVKDFFAFKRGITLSIPESAKPGIYQRVRRIVTAENLTGAVLGAAVLAVLVNIIELLCTAGLPALYTQILSAQQLPPWQNYAYLLLYIGAYMFDDTLMVGLVVLTLERHKLQESHGRWLKLISGLAILGLGAVMVLRPDWLGMN